MASHALYRLIERLDRCGYHYVLSRHRPDSILVSITFVGERVEVDVLEDGTMEVSRFKGSEDIVGDEALIWDLIDQNQRDDEKEPNQAPLPTPASVTPAADAPVAPPSGAAGL